MKKEPDNKFEPLIEILAVLLAIGVIAVLASIFYISSNRCGEPRSLTESRDCFREPR